MKNILIIGAGRSSTDLIDYLLDKSTQYDWKIMVADRSINLVSDKVHGHINGRGVGVDILDQDERRKLIGKNDLVISMLPPSLHIFVAKDCLSLGRHLLTASYISDEMFDLAQNAREQNLIFMGELGLDPGLDHISAMKKMDEIKEKGGILSAFNSYTGGLVAPSSDTNPWHYKFTWNPRNVVLAGQGTASFIEAGSIQYIPYHRLFESKRIVDILNFGPLEMYPNRDSIKYKAIYGLDDLPTLLRGTLRYPDFCDAWDALVKIGLTDNSIVIHNANELTYRAWLLSFVQGHGDQLEKNISKMLHLSEDSKVIHQCSWLGLFSKEKIILKEGTSAEILEQLLLKKWKMEEDDLDMIVMQHEFFYSLDDISYKDTSTLVHTGKDSHHTAMSQLVGLPLGIFAKEVMIGHISHVSVARPVTPDIYLPILAELEEMGITFLEKTVEVDNQGSNAG